MFRRFVGHVRNVNYQNATRNDRQTELVGTFWCPTCEGKNTARARERRKVVEMSRRVKITKVVKKKIINDRYLFLAMLSPK